MSLGYVVEWPESDNEAEARFWHGLAGYVVDLTWAPSVDDIEVTDTVVVLDANRQEVTVTPTGDRLPYDVHLTRVRKVEIH